MIFPDSDIVRDLLRKFPPAIGWFDSESQCWVT
jgi:hypothetical protein